MPVCTENGVFIQLYLAFGIFISDDYLFYDVMSNAENMVGFDFFKNVRINFLKISDMRNIYLFL